jgi:hypothetical protein
MKKSLKGTFLEGIGSVYSRQLWETFLKRCDGYAELNHPDSDGDHRFIDKSGNKSGCFHKDAEDRIREELGIKRESERPKPFEPKEEGLAVMRALWPDNYEDDLRALRNANGVVTLRSSSVVVNILADGRTVATFPGRVLARRFCKALGVTIEDYL